MQQNTWMYQIWFPTFKEVVCIKKHFKKSSTIEQHKKTLYDIKHTHKRKIAQTFESILQFF